MPILHGRACIGTQIEKINSHLTALTVFLLVAGILVGIFVPTKYIHLKSRDAEHLSISKYTVSLDDNGEIRNFNYNPIKAEELLAELFDAFNFNLQRIHSKQFTIPKLILWRLPKSLQSLNDTSVRKQLFIKILLPLIIDKNKAILKKRRKIITLKKRGLPNLKNHQKNWVKEQFRYYKILSMQEPKSEIDAKLFNELLLRVNILPIPLAIAQAAIETGWGTSRFALIGNALFGQWTWKEGGLTPSRRDHGQGHSIRSFINLRDSVANYAQNLNSSDFYSGFRIARLNFIKDARYSKNASTLLAKHISSYSQEGQDYVEKLLRVINSNRLERFESLSNELRPVNLDIHLALKSSVTEQ